ncbi:hypothetical protein QIS99_18775 [Streptomyces sp. B-S-A8]|uniref:DUF7224 domain-containing protein n=1 Tax=Streptomyces solicavernae TaxID=3043614 RepID=A0ABT6RUW4_9ACTN|nr:hypothetical protein [Streptomyces sp. B-S-A8]MDI3388233.1 hypothetical protein [Streptomyces sp. B-S-A8]
MNLTWANLRSSAAPWIVLPAVFYISLYLGDITYSVPSHYGVESGETAAFAMAVIAPAAAAATAWEAGRYRLIGPVRSTSTRSPLVRFLRAAAPALLLYLVLAVAALVLARHATGVWPGGAGWFAVAHLVVLPLGWAVIGWFVGGAVPRSVAAPVVAIGCWGWLAMPHAMSNPSLRHLGGFIDGGSSVTDIRDAAVYLVPWGVVAGLAAAAWLMTGANRRGLKSTLAAAVAAATLTAGCLAVTDWGYRVPTHPRVVAMSCTGQDPRVCVPPEYQPYAEQLRKEAGEPLNRLKAAGVPAPQELRISSPETPPRAGTWPLQWSLPALDGPSGQDQYKTDLAEAAVAGTAANAGVRDCRQPGSVAAAWATLVIGADARSVQQAVSPADWSALQQIRRLPAEEQAEWFERKAASQEHCVEVAP